MSFKNRKWKLNINSKDPTPSEYSYLLNYVQVNERNRILKFRFEADKKRALFGHLMIKHMIKSIFKVSLKDIQIKRTKLNKPYYEQDIYTKFDFNISHHGDWIVLVWDFASNVGVDVTQIKSGNNVKTDTDIMKYISTFQREFTESEFSFIGNDLSKFSQNWALKEAFIKAIGKGLFFKLQNISFKFSDLKDITYKLQNKAEVEAEKEIPKLNFTLEALDSSHYVALASSSEYFSHPKNQIWSFVEICVSQSQNKSKILVFKLG